MKPNTPAERLYNGIIKENPTFVLMLGMCPTLAVTTSAMNALGMGLSTTVVLIFSNLLISLFRKVIPNGVRMPAYIVIVASLVTIVEFIMKAYTPALATQLGVYIPLIVVNCIILGRAESYASKNPPVLSILDGVGMGLGFTFGLTCIGIVREILGAGQLFGFQILSLKWYTPINIFVMAPGAFFMATDYVTSPITPKGQILYGILLGILTGLFRIFGANAEGVSFAIILSNLLVPMIEKITIPKAFGQVKEAKQHE